MSASESDLWVFRDARTLVSGRVLVRELQRTLDKLLQGSASETQLVEAIIRAGSLESALADADAAGAHIAAVVTDSVTTALFTPNPDSLRRAASALQSLSVPATIPTSPPEGFSYYAVHPLDFVTAANKLSLSSSIVAVIGIRNIGATLSAIVTAALRARGQDAARMTVRANGHPYERNTVFSEQQKSWIREQLDLASEFLIVDEGPGRSGSTFLSVGEALLQAGVPFERITFLGTRDVDPAQLCAQDAVRRWSKFRLRAARQVTLDHFSNYSYLGAGEWRHIFLPHGTVWPECWPQMERLKFLSPDRTQIFKFEGMGSAGAAVRERSRRIAAARFGPGIDDAQAGFSSYSVISGRPMSSAEVSEHALERIAEYCAFRLSEFRTDNDHFNSLPDMLASNLVREFQVEPSSDWPMLGTDTPVLVDGRMQPHEWISLPDGSMFKTDGASHGDDHFLPGPTDITWDLAGASLEWNLSRDAESFLLSRFQRLTGKDPKPSFSVFKLAYAVFRVAWCKMAATTVPGSAEDIRLRTAYASYSASVRDQLRRPDLQKPRNSLANQASAEVLIEAAPKSVTAESTPVLHDCSDCP